MKIIFNGAIFSSGRKDGIPRYTLEILKSLDKIVGSDEFELLSPVELDFSFENIKIVKYCSWIYRLGKFGGELWRQIIIFCYAKKNSLIVDLGMMLPFLRNDVCAIYDCQPEKFPSNYDRGFISRLGKKIRLAQRKNAILNSKLIITDSYDAAKDIMHYYNVKKDKIKVVYCGWQHFLPVEMDESIFEKYTVLRNREYFFSLGSRFKHKNIEWVLSAAKQNKKYIFVISGENNVATYSKKIISNAPDNVIFTGFISDGEVKALMKHCKAFIQPSISEGFGIPPLEALSVGAELVVSNVSCLPEIYKDCAHYIDPYFYDSIDMDSVLSKKLDNPSKLLNEYSWDRSARQLYEYITDFLDKDTSL